MKTSVNSPVSNRSKNKSERVKNSENEAFITYQDQEEHNA